MRHHHTCPLGAEESEQIRRFKIVIHFPRDPDRISQAGICVDVAFLVQFLQHLLLIRPGVLLHKQGRHIHRGAAEKRSFTLMRSGADVESRQVRTKARCKVEDRQLRPLTMCIVLCSLDAVDCTLDSKRLLL